MLRFCRSDGTEGQSPFTGLHITDLGSDQRQGKRDRNGFKKTDLDKHKSAISQVFFSPL